jgi:hypothetical protein
MNVECVARCILALRFNGRFRLISTQGGQWLIGIQYDFEGFVVLPSGKL